MEVFTLVMIAAFMGLIAWIVSGSSQEDKQRVDTLAHVAKQIAGTQDEKGMVVTGELAGVTLVFRYTWRGSGKHRRRWTEVDVEIPPKYPLTIFIRAHAWLDQGKIDRGEMVDVIVGDPVFDDRFLVEAAPGDVARVLLDDRARSYMLLLAEKHQVELVTVRPDDAPPILRLAIYTWLIDPTEAMPAIEMVAAIAGRVRSAYAAVEQALESRDVGSPFRPVLDDTRAREGAEERLNEVRRLDKIHIERKASEHALAVVIAIIFVTFFIVALASTA